MSLQTVADFIEGRHDDGRAAIRAVFAERDAEWKRRYGEARRPTTEQVNGLIQERIRCLRAGLNST